MELLVALLALVGLACVALPALGASATRSRLGQCSNNLRQIGRGFQAWASQHGEQFPWLVSPADGGLNNNGNASPISNNPFIHFSIISNELGSPRVLVCPSDPVKKVAKDFSANSDGGFNNVVVYANSALSYFVGMDARLERPKTLLTGDRNIKTSRNRVNGTVFVSVTSVDGKDPNIGFTNGMHRFYGNVGLTDGSVISAGNVVFRELAQNSGDAVDAGAIGGPAPNNDVLVPGQPHPAVE
ncbi:MAG TPA: hypothetical protein VGF13_10965 [Verrucomicrobiae bacterium]